MFIPTNGLIGTVVGLILALVGVVTLIAFNHRKIGIGLLAAGMLVLAVGVNAFITNSKASPTWHTGPSPQQKGVINTRPKECSKGHRARGKWVRACHNPPHRARCARGFLPIPVQM